MDATKGNNFITIIFDSCRFDSFEAANPKTILKLGTLERRWSYATWTAPSHYNLLMGLMPHTWITITADHGEVFGEGGYFGHGPVQHEKGFEVPFIEGKLR